MNLIYFLIILLIIYFVASQIQVTHITALPSANRQKIKPKTTDPIEINTRNVDPYNTANGRGISQASSLDSRDYRINYYDLGKEYQGDLPDANGLILLIKNDYLDTFYKFNISNQPVITRNSGNSPKDKKYLNEIKKDILSWNDIFEKYYGTHNKYIKVTGIKIINIKETESEFVTVVGVALSYRSKAIYLRLSYYGQVERTDDFLNGGRDTYLLQMFDLQQINRSDYQPEINPHEQANNFTSYKQDRRPSYWENTPFSSMDEQLKYVQQVNQMHKNELNLD
jgi:hypothetical protein